MARASTFRKIAGSQLFVSEPNPVFFGNGPNEPHLPGWTNQNWLKSRFHFSFAEYSSRDRDNFGVLRVMNDDLVQPARGFGTHPHRDMEICTYIVNGALTHQDSMGSAETLPRGSVQYMSAGTGIRHSEHNNSPSEAARFVQMWLVPRKRGLQPRYGGTATDASLRKNRFFHLVSDVDDSASDTPVKIHQDANMFVTEADPGVSVPISLKAGRQAYVLCIEGSEVAVDGLGAGPEKLAMYDAAEVVGPADLTFTPQGGSGHVLVVEMAQS